MNAFDLYKQYLSLKRHFTSDFDYFKYNGKSRATVVGFQKRKDKWMFTKLATKKDPVSFMLATFIEKPDAWIGDIVSRDGNARYIEWLKRTESMFYNFSNSLEILDDDLNKNFELEENSSYPKLLNLFFQKKITIEDLVILNMIFNFVPKWDKIITDTILWPQIKCKIVKYSPFVMIELYKYKEQAKKRWLK